MDECYIKANKEGLQIFALQLLKAAAQTETILAHKEKNIIPLNLEGNWMDKEAAVIFEYIEPISTKPEMPVRQASSSPAKDKLFSYGCGIGLIILLIAVLVGLASMLSWLF